MASSKRQKQRAKKLVMAGRDVLVLREENENLREQVAAYQGMKRGVEIRIGKLQQELEEAKTTITLQIIGITGLESSREECRREIASAKAKLCQTQEGLDATTREYDKLLKLDHEAAPLRRRLQTAKDELRHARSEILRLKKLLHKAGEDF